MAGPTVRGGDSGRTSHLAGHAGPGYPGMVPVPHVTLLTKPGCHLCDDARLALEAVLDEVEFRGARDYDELNILDDPSLLDEYAEEIPVVLIDDRVHTIWRVDQDRLRTALRAATPAGPTR
jgi:glutaredoxin